MKGDSDKSVPDRGSSLGKDPGDRENKEWWELCVRIHLGCMLEPGVWEWRDDD